jgi:hypothetical protein
MAKTSNACWEKYRYFLQENSSNLQMLVSELSETNESHN